MNLILCMMTLLEQIFQATDSENDYKLRYIKDTADSFLIAKKDANDKITWSVDMNKINTFMTTNTVEGTDE